MNKEYLAATATNEKIYICSDTYEHMLAHPDVKIEDVVEAIPYIETYNGTFGMCQVNLGKEIGHYNVVELLPGDTVEYHHRKNRAGRSPFVREREAEPTHVITLGICKDDDGLHTMFTAFYGPVAPREPWDKNIKTQAEATEAQEFWSTHAFIYDESVIED